MKRIYQVPDKKFIETYLQFEDNFEVSKALDVPDTYVARRAAKLRSKGVRLPYRYRLQEPNVDELNDLIWRIESEKLV